MTTRLKLGQAMVRRVKAAPKKDTTERVMNQNHSMRKILSLMMLRLRMHMAWSTLRLPVSAPEGNWHLHVQLERCSFLTFSTHNTILQHAILLDLDVRQTFYAEIPARLINFMAAGIFLYLFEGGPVTFPLKGPYLNDVYPERGGVTKMQTREVERF